MESYCPVSECGTCAGIGEVLTDTGVKTCMTCHGAGRQTCAASELRLRVRALEAMKSAADPMPVVALALTLAGLSVVLILAHILFGTR